MQFTELELPGFNVYCPASGECILKEDEPCNDDAKSLIAYWVDEVMDEPMIKSEQLRKDWESYREENKDEDDFYTWELLEKFLKEYPEPFWACFKITICGMGCSGPTSSTVWKVLNLMASYESDEK
jgi:hypothetical protein